ncbi:hypothetical protein [Saccharopolyspora sp. 5N708]|uniref:hypothetical protein n=1 Tax=Saccharopolyspora sp. 5N708 TaxID=3457424 RepID=UPI003FD2F1B7
MIESECFRERLTADNTASLDVVVARHGASWLKVARVWFLHRPATMLLTPGRSSVRCLVENVATSTLALSPRELAELDRAA